MGRLFILKEVTGPEQVRRELADPTRQWREGYSACELARSWLRNPDGLPSAVQQVLDGYPLFAGAELIEAFFERKVELGSPGRASQNDAIAYCVCPATRFVAAVEGKVKETFGPYVYERASDPSRDTRVTSLCDQLGLPTAAVASIRYQLLHRAVSALREARRYRAPDAILLVHSFDGGDSSLRDYQSFAAVLGLPGDAAIPNQICGSRELDGIRFHLGWVREEPGTPDGFGLAHARQPRKAASVEAVDPRGQAASQGQGGGASETQVSGQKPGGLANTPAASGQSGGTLPPSVQALIDRIRTAPRSPHAKGTSVISSNVSSGFKKAMGGEDYKSYYEIELRRAIAELGATCGVQLPQLVELAVLLRSESPSVKWTVIQALSTSPE